MIYCTDAGVVPFDRAMVWQRDLANKRRQERTADHLLLLEHPPTYTMGRRDSSSDLLVTEDWIRSQGMDFCKTDRGGRVTYHGPGQLVGYFILRLKDSVPKLVWKIEETLLRVLDHFHVEAERDADYPGLWIDNRKIAALGLHIERGVTTHGFALNVSCDLKPFQYIHPCGIKERGVTSLEKETGWRPSMRDVKQMVLMECAKVFETNVSVDGLFPTIPE